MSKKNIRQIIRYLLFFIGSLSSLYAQVSEGGFPFPEQFPENTKLRSSQASTPSQIPFIDMPAFDKEALLREDALSENKVGAIRFANKFHVSITPENAGVSTVLNDGTTVWRVGIRSLGAFSLNLLFTEYQLPPGAKVFVYSPNRNMILGAFTEKNNQASGVFPVAPVDGDEIIVEYSEPANVPFKGKLKIGEVNHDYRGLRVLPGQSKDPVLPCEVNATCNDIYPQQRRSACVIVVDGETYCSGNLVNNTGQDGTPYILSAAHCLYDGRNNVVPSKAERSVFFFNYETPHCFSDVQGSLEMSIAGSTVQAALKQRDMLLLRLNETPPVDYRVYYAGWNTSPTVSGQAYCFHHPQGNVKKISIEHNTPTADTFLPELFARNGHWRIARWEQGVTEPGSSGSGLFDSGNRIIGNLSGGSSDCETPQEDYFYRLNAVWNNSSYTDNENLKPWLDPADSNALLLDGKEADENPCVRLTNWQEGESLSATNFSDGYAAGHNELKIREFAERFSFSESSELYGVYFLPQKGLYNENAPVIAEIYSGDTTPKELLHRQIVKITNTQFLSGKFQEKNLIRLWQKEHYLRLSKTVKVDTSFFVVFRLPEIPVDTFALYHTSGREDGDLNTAWFKDGLTWKPFSVNPLNPQPASLMVDVVVRPTGLNSVTSPGVLSTQTEIFPNPVKDELTIRFAENRNPVQFHVFDLSGKVLFTENNLQGFTSYRLHTGSFCDKGVFFLQIVYTDRTEVLKFIKL